LTEEQRQPAAIVSTDAAPVAPRTTPARIIAGRLFVVGCPRSGTTLLQSLFAAHPAVLSFPETAVFGRLLTADVLPGETRLGSIHFRTQLAHLHAMDVLDATGRRDLEPILPSHCRSISQFVDGFMAMLDRLTLDKDKSWWVEKTTENIRYVPEILALVPGAKFVAISRDGRQNVAALYDMACKYPDRWWSRFRDLDQAIDVWNRCAIRTRQLLRMPEVLVLRHERLLSDTEAVVQEACRFLGLPFTRQMIDCRAQAASSVITEHEPWKADVLTPMRSATDDKFGRLFDAGQKAYIEARLERIEFG
jgi:Sulfotransferase family